MNKIKILSPEQAQKIAAGEVIERPANIVKELLENALDAEATAISLCFEKAGKQLIKIIDNGCGMSSEDAYKCFLPHATSKITSIDELESLNSFGFRGEALASIAAISKVKLTTKTSTDSTGICLDYTEGRVVNEKLVSCNTGTDLEIHDLFYNVPARKKFLKQDETEWNQILSLFYAFCLSNKTIGFKLYHENKLIFNLPAAQALKDRITQLWDHNFAQQLLELIPLLTQTTGNGGLKIEGFISNHHFWRYGKNTIYFFVNNRWIKNQELTKALLKGYLNVLPPGKFPAAFVFLTIDKTLVDINCHPKKEEVRFTKPTSVEQAILTCVKQTLEQQINTALSLGEKQHIQNQFHQQHAQTTATSSPFFINKSFDFEATSPHQVTPLPSWDSNKITNIYPSTNTPIPQTKQVQELEATTPLTQEPYTLIGQLFNTYIIIENEQALILIDQHAAHERILYENLLKNFENKEGTRLLFPEIISLLPHQITKLLNEQPFLNNQGINIEQIGEHEIAIKTAPPQLYNTSLKDFILDALTFIEENDYLDQEEYRKKLNEHVHSHMACKAAIKAGDVLTTMQMHQLITDLQKTEKRFICIHGRPTMWNITKEDIEKQFRRR